MRRKDKLHVLSQGEPSYVVQHLALQIGMQMQFGLVHKNSNRALLGDLGGAAHGCQVAIELVLYEREEELDDRLFARTQVVNVDKDVFAVHMP